MTETTSTIRPYKFIVQAILQKIEGDVVVGEIASEPIAIFGCAALSAWAQDQDKGVNQ